MCWALRTRRRLRSRSCLRFWKNIPWALQPGPVPLLKTSSKVPLVYLLLDFVVRTRAPSGAWNLPLFLRPSPRARRWRRRKRRRRRRRVLQSITTTMMAPSLPPSTLLKILLQIPETAQMAALRMTPKSCLKNLLLNRRTTAMTTTTRSPRRVVPVTRKTTTRSNSASKAEPKKNQTGIPMHLPRLYSHTRSSSMRLLPKSQLAKMTKERKPTFLPNLLTVLMLLMLLMTKRRKPTFLPSLLT